MSARSGRLRYFISLAARCPGGLPHVSKRAIDCEYRDERDTANHQKIRQIGAQNTIHDERYLMVTGPKGVMVALAISQNNQCLGSTGVRTIFCSVIS